MEPQAYRLLLKIHKLLKDKTVGELNERELAFIAGILDSIVEVYGPLPEDQPDTLQPRRRSWWTNLLP